MSVRSVTTTGQGVHLENLNPASPTPSSSQNINALTSTVFQKLSFSTLNTLPEQVLTTVLTESDESACITILALANRLGTLKERLNFRAVDQQILQRRPWVDSLNPWKDTHVDKLIAQQDELRAVAEKLCEETLYPTHSPAGQLIAAYKASRAWMGETERYIEKLQVLKDHLMLGCNLLSKKQREEIEKMWESGKLDDKTQAITKIVNSFDHNFLFDQQWMNDPQNQTLIQTVKALNLSFIPDDKKLRAIPPEIRKFTSLESLSLNNNKLENIPKLAFCSSSLRSLIIKNNPLKIFTLSEQHNLHLTHLDLNDSPLLREVNIRGNIGRVLLLQNPSLKEIRFTGIAGNHLLIDDSAAHPPTFSHNLFTVQSFFKEQMLSSSKYGPTLSLMEQKSHPAFKMNIIWILSQRENPQAVLIQKIWEASE